MKKKLLFITLLCIVSIKGWSAPLKKEHYSFFPVGTPYRLFLGANIIHALTVNGHVDDLKVKFIEPVNTLNQVGQFERVELGFKLPVDIEKQVSEFVTNGKGGLNPFDPEQISVEALFNNGAKQYTVYGYYYEDFTRDQSAMTPFAPAKWLEVETNFHWRVRFAPPDTGNWNCILSVRMNNAQDYSYTIKNIFFECIPSANQGWLTKGNDSWHLAYSGSQKSFFALGQNIAWTDGSYFRGGKALPEFNRLYAGGFLDVREWVVDLAESGGNMVRIATVPWSWDFEYEQLNNYSDRLDRAWELDELVELCEQKQLEISFDLQFFATSNTDSNSVFSWAKNPYHTQIVGVNEPDDFLTNLTAQKKFKNKLRYFLSRWGYSTSIGILTLTGEIDGWEKDPDSKVSDEKQKNWYSIMIPYARNLVAYRSLLTATSYTSGHWGREHRNGPFDYEGLDILALHPYNAERDANIERRYNEFNRNVVERGVHSIWPGKLAYIQEMGLPGAHPADGNDIEGCNDISYHNAIWSTAFMGGLGIGFPWWQWFNSQFRHDNYPALNSFFKGIDFQAVEYTDPDIWDDSFFANNNHSGSKIETFYIRGKHAREIIGWAHNTSYWWGNMVQDCTDRWGKHMEIKRADSDDKPTLPMSLSAKTRFEIHKLNNLENYSIEWYQTRLKGGVVGNDVFQANIFGTLKPLYPQLDMNPQVPDFAYKIHLSEGKSDGSKNISSDTLLNYESFVEVHGNHQSDSLGLFHYHWIFGNGQESNDRDSFVIYDRPGTYLVTLIVTDSFGWSDTLQQYIVKPSVELF